MPHADEQEKRAAVLEALKHAEKVCSTAREVVSTMRVGVVRTKLAARLIDAVRQLEAGQRVINQAHVFERGTN